MLVANKKIAIVGGGPGGLMLARLLQQKGADVKVYERDLNKEVRVQGATLDLHQHSGLKAMKAAGLMEAFKTGYRPSADKGRLMDKHAHMIYDEHNDKNRAEEDLDSRYARPEIDRGPLRNMLLNSLKAGTVVWDSHFVTMVAVGDAWQLEFKNGTTAIADIVIAADGANSKIRPFVMDAVPTYAGVTIIQGNIDHAATVMPTMHELAQGGKIYVHNDGRSLHVSAKGDGSIDFYISFKREEHWLRDSGVDFNDRTQVVAWAKEELAGWDGIWLQLFEHTSLPLLLRPQYVMPLDKGWGPQPNLTMLGDAAHIMPPSGEGVNLAMLDAVELTECLTGIAYKDIPTAIAAYEQQMWARGAQEAKEALEMVDWMHGDDAQARMLALVGPGE